MDLLFFAYADQRKDLPAIGQEAEYHYSLLASGIANNHFKVHSDRSATISTLSEFLSRFRQEVFLFHYSGHAGDNILELEAGETALSEGVAHLLAQCPNLKLVVLNGCCTAGQAIGEDHLLPLLQRWQKEHTRILQRGRGATRLSNLELSLELTLQGKRRCASLPRNSRPHRYPEPAVADTP